MLKDTSDKDQIQYNFFSSKFQTISRRQRGSVEGYGAGEWFKKIKVMAVCYKDDRQENWFRRLAKKLHIQETIREERRGLRGNKQNITPFVLSALFTLWDIFCQLWILACVYLIPVVSFLLSLPPPPTPTTNSYWVFITHVLEFILPWKFWEGNVNIRMSKPVENFYEFIWTKLKTNARKQDLKCSEEEQFEVSFMHLELRDYRRGETAR